MIQVFQYDINFLLTDILIVEEIDEEGNYVLPENSTTISPPEGLYKPKFYPDENVWKESATQEYIDSMQPPEPDPDPTELLKKQSALLSLQVARLQADVEALKGGGAS
ncbi:hypothetical protein C6W27_23290 [Bacillus paralicheniformis]|uniref:hypothetical protein n=1 Tax=Bacillus paralicheniformis TaxID=1648923 RepID=UPI000D042C4B|nr:hypothetical protein [Bacillus paralicheniformis]PRS07515.1 hypothetical protein C6W27_23290 [Bacillus paralicheniformis]TWK37791.1 hypothetical protein CHCC20347_2295 [Bacillus paralicheniformis]